MIDRLSRNSYNQINEMAILGVYTKLDEVTNLQCDYLEALGKCQSLENEISKRNTTSTSFEALQTKQPIIVLISTREPKTKVNQSVATSLKKTVALESTNQKPRSTVKFGNDQIALILGYGDLFQGNVTIKRKSTCYIRDLKGNDLLTASSSQAWLWHRLLLYLNFDIINLFLKYDIVTNLLKLNFVKDHHCSSYELGKAKCTSYKTKTTSSSKRRLQILHMDLCGPMRVESFNGKKYVLVIVDDYSRYTWTHFLKSKDETPEVLIDFLKLVQRGLHAQVRIVQTDKGT
ncbi:retrovirus-related pol polyprotein from transposon TNT 1-94 [Tanacetum coccineum]